jgi:hypothetical protein
MSNVHRASKNRLSGLAQGERTVNSLGTRVTYPPHEKTPKGEVHEDIGLISYDRGRKAFVLRQFHKEGFVNTYAGASDNPRVFTTEAIENIPAGFRRVADRVCAIMRGFYCIAFSQMHRDSEPSVLAIARSFPRRAEKATLKPTEIP